jgi:hypothetical protein
MSRLQELKCKLRLHRWGAVVADDRGAHQVCAYCGDTRRIGLDQPPETHDHSGINR